MTKKQRRTRQIGFADMLGSAAATLVAGEHGAASVQIGHCARALRMPGIQDAVLGGFGIPTSQAAPPDAGTAS